MLSGDRFFVGAHLVCVYMCVGLSVCTFGHLYEMKYLPIMLMLYDQLNNL